ncbi:hypothetical protein MNBD_GAMMA02-695 [hydrothermal vent metagenome]|uniref:Lysoplasmalogenase n=1 Tax=hydrothermal vent metagenome TaxID=652676 RepID=A0A3B0W3B7_9ZZZZ
MTLLLPTVCLFACALSIGFETKQQNKLALKTKLLASLAFVGFAWELGAWNSQYGQILFIGLVLSMLGDWLLALKEKKWFLVGIGAFLFTHFAYAWAFLHSGLQLSSEIDLATEKLALILPVIMVALVLVAWWLRTHLHSTFKTLVPLYLMAIGLMLVSAWGNEAQAAWWWIVGGASLFAISDLFVARNRFIQNDDLNHIIGLPIYYVAQLMLAYSTSLVV